MGLNTYDKSTVDSAGAFLLSELERLDHTMHEPLLECTWGRDIDLREDVCMADEMSSFTNSTFAAAGGAGGSGKSWIGKNTTAIPGVAVDVNKTASPLRLWGLELSYTIPELLSAQALGRPVDLQKLSVIHTKWNMDVDEMVYIGDAALGATGLVNSKEVSHISVSGGDWSTKTPDEILEDVNKLLSHAWEQSGYTIVPTCLRVPPLKFGQLASGKVSDAGNVSMLEYLKVNSLSNARNGRLLDIQPLKWLEKAGSSGKDRMMAYTKDLRRVRYPLVPMQRTPIEHRGIYHFTTYYGRLGQVELVYPEAMAYSDGI